MPIHFMPIYGRKMYGQLKRPPMEEWSKQRHVDHVALIYFQKMLQVLTPHTSKLPKKVLKNTKNMTPNSCSVRPEKFHPYTLTKIRHRNKCTPMVSKVGALEIFRDKRVYYKVRSDITIVCKAMEFALYPLDNHKCYLILTSCKKNI